MATDMFIVRIISHRGKKAKDTFPWIQVHQLTGARRKPMPKLKIQESGYSQLPIKLGHDYPIRPRLNKVAGELGIAILEKSNNIQIYSKTVKSAP